MTPAYLRRLRRRLRLSQDEMAARLAVAPNTLARWERGEIGMHPSSVRLVLLVEHLAEIGDDYAAALAGTAKFKRPRR